MAPRADRVAFFMPDLGGGGAERIMLILAAGLVERGIDLDFVLGQATGPYLSRLPSCVRVIDLGSRRIFLSPPRLRRYLESERPVTLMSALDHANLAAIWARRSANVSSRVVVAVHNTLSQDAGNPRNRRERLIPPLIRRFYPSADAIVCVSRGVADDLARTTGLPRERLEVIVNPVVTPGLLEQAAEPLEHPWFASDQPVVLGVGRLTRQKDFPMLIRAFARVRRERPCRLLILGEGEDRGELERLVRSLELTDSVAMPGYVANPYAYMARAGVFVLSSRWEGLPTVLIEAGAVGAPLVSTDCPSGPREILEDGANGVLVPVGDEGALVAAIERVLTGAAPKASAQVWQRYAQDVAVERYLQVLLPDRQAQQVPGQSVP